MTMPSKNAKNALSTRLEILHKSIDDQVQKVIVATHNNAEHSPNAASVKADASVENYSFENLSGTQMPMEIAGGIILRNLNILAELNEGDVR